MTGPYAHPPVALSVASQPGVLPMSRPLCLAVSPGQAAEWTCVLVLVGLCDSWPAGLVTSTDHAAVMMPSRRQQSRDGGYVLPGPNRRSAARCSSESFSLSLMGRGKTSASRHSSDRTLEATPILFPRACSSSRRALTLQVPLDVHRATLQLAGAEASVYRPGDRRGLELDAQYLRCDPLTEMPSSHWPLDDPGDERVDLVALAEELGEVLERRSVHATESDLEAAQGEAGARPEPSCLTRPTTWHATTPLVSLGARRRRSRSAGSQDGRPG